MKLVKYTFLSFLYLFLSFGFTKAQVPYNESFEGSTIYPTNSLPLGWTTGKYGVSIDPDNYWDMSGIGSVNPTTNPRTGNGMARYRSFSIPLGEKAYLTTKRLDMTSMPVTGAVGSFWMFRDNGYTTSLDSVNVYANTVNNMSGTPVRINATANIPRYCGAAPTTTCGTWYQVTFTIPGAAPFLGSNNVFISIVGASAFGNNIYVDDFTINTYPNVNQSYVSSALIFQNTAPTAPNQVNQDVVGLRISVVGSGTAIGLRDLIFNTNGCSNPVTDITAAKLWFTGGTNFFDQNTAILLGNVANPWSTNYTFLTTSFTGLDNGDNYFWVTYDINLSAGIGNFVDADVVGFNTIVGSTPTARTPIPQTLTGGRPIDLVYCQPIYSSGTSWQNYTNNDYIHRVICVGDVAPGINNQYNTNGPSSCSPSPAQCPFSAHPPDYEFFPPSNTKTAVFTAGNTYSITLQVGTYNSSNYIAAWVDYNKDGVFQSTERIAQSGSLGTLGTYTISFTVPLTSAAGNTRLRVREVFAQSNIDPCAPAGFGETEDYVVTIIPPCAPAWPGWKTWLGFTNDWNNPANWCGGVPTISDDARIPGFGGPNGRSGNFSPVIKAGVLATARNLRIESNDTITVNAPNNSSLTVNGTLTILDNTSALIVNSTFSDTAQLNNGTLIPPTVPIQNAPFKNSAKVRNIWLYTQTELLAEGMSTGDVINGLLMHIKRNYTNTGAIFKNLTIKMYYTTGGFNSFRFNGANPSMPPIVGPAPVVVYGPMDYNIATYIPTANTSGTIPFTLSTPFTWDGSVNKLVIDMSWDNYGLTTINTSDYPTFTQQTGLQHFISIINTRNNLSYPAGTMTPPRNVVSTGVITNTTGTNILNVTIPTVDNLVPGMWVSGIGVSVSTTGTWVIGGNTITVTNAANIQIGHYVLAGSSPGYQVTNISGTTITVSGTFTSPGTNTSVIFHPEITGVSGTSVTLSHNTYAAISGSYGFGTNNSFPSTGTDYRPNITFQFSRPYTKFNINVKTDWINNGTFTSGISNVNMNGSLTQILGGLFTTSFYDLTINNTNHITLQSDAIVTDTLRLTNGRLRLNNKLLNVTNSNFGAITRTGGFIQSESTILGSDVAPFGRIRWIMGSTTGLRVIPFINQAGNSIFLDYNVDSGNHDVTFATYGTTANNQNIPLPTVTNITSPTWAGTGFGIADRFYYIDNSGNTGQADVTMRYANSERAQSGNIDMRGQRWLNTSNAWELPLYSNQTHTIGTPDAVTLNDYTDWTSGYWWTVTGILNPLPVELLEFKATKHNDKVRLDWTTATESNSSHYLIHRTTDMVNYNYIDSLKSHGFSVTQTSYRTWDLNPTNGMQYYVLHQYDLNGVHKVYGPVSVEFSNSKFEITQVSYNQNQLEIRFNNTYDESITINVLDYSGRKILEERVERPSIGVNKVMFNKFLSEGIYHIVLNNSKESVNSKLYFQK